MGWAQHENNKFRTSQSVCKKRVQKRLGRDKTLKFSLDGDSSLALGMKRSGMRNLHSCLKTDYLFKGIIKMKQIIYNDYNELSLKTAEQIAAIISKKPDALLCFPAGETSVGTFKQLIELNNKGKISFKKCKIVGLDEWANIGEMK